MINPINNHPGLGQVSNLIRTLKNHEAYNQRFNFEGNDTYDKFRNITTGQYRRIHALLQAKKHGELITTLMDMGVPLNV